MLLLTIGIYRLFQRNWGKVIVGAMLLLIIYIDVDYYARPVMPTTHRYVRNYREVGEFLRENTKPGDLIYLHLDHYSVLNTKYYLGNFPVEVDTYYRDYHFEHIIHNQALDYINKVDLWGMIDGAHTAGRDVWLVVNDPRGAFDQPLITKTADLNLGIDSDKACDIRLFDLDKRYPQARIADNPGDILKVIYIPCNGER